MTVSTIDVQSAISAVSTAIGLVVLAGGGIGAVAVGILKVFGDKWLNAKFEQRLEAYKHAQQRELEQLKYQINTLMDRTVKLHQREFEVLPEAWGKLLDAYNKAQAHLAFFQQYPDLERMGEAALKEFVEKTPFEQWEKDEILDSHNKNDQYIQSISWHNHFEARNFSANCHIYLRKNGIFIPGDLKALFQRVDELIFKALIEFEMHKRCDEVPKQLRKLEDRQRLFDEGEAILKQLEQEVQGRLWKSDSARL